MDPLKVLDQPQPLLRPENRVAPKKETVRRIVRRMVKILTFRQTLFDAVKDNTGAAKENVRTMRSICTIEPISGILDTGYELLRTRFACAGRSSRRMFKRWEVGKKKQPLHSSWPKPESNGRLLLARENRRTVQLIRMRSWSNNTYAKLECSAGTTAAERARDELRTCDSGTGTTRARGRYARSHAGASGVQAWPDGPGEYLRQYQQANDGARLRAPFGANEITGLHARGRRFVPQQAKGSKSRRSADAG
ncbi:hypothetical protein C8J57DRAFT_1459539 [Mycena rebaudengoi]|nr:hypothetical protein C8J57DRAFT_1459539 [Mycena rebaudengoi]